MAEYIVGRGKPPKCSQFQPGTSGNPKGRPKRTADPLGDVVQGVMDAPTKYRENGRTKTAPRIEVRLKMLRREAINGSVSAADALFEERKHALKHGGNRTLQLVVTDFLPDFDGQTAEQKTAARAATAPNDIRRRRGRKNHEGQPIGPVGDEVPEQGEGI